jgi:hypothetical protein
MKYMNKSGKGKNPDSSGESSLPYLPVFISSCFPVKIAWKITALLVVKD